MFGECASRRVQQPHDGHNRRVGFPPLLSDLRGLTRAQVRRDVLAGLTVAAYAIPQVMAYSALAGLPPQSGLWVLAVVVPVYLLFGSSRYLSVGPESTTALLTAATLSPLALGDPTRYASLAALLALMLGGLSLLAWALRLGFLGDLLSKPILVGYMAGVAVIMIVSQLGKVTGVGSVGTTLTDELTSFGANITETHWPTLVLAGAVLILLLVASPRFPRVPVPLIVVLFATIVTSAFDLAAVGIETVGAVPSGLPSFGLASINGGDVGLLLLPAIGLLVVAYSDNLLTARMFAARHHQYVDSNRELLGLGTANVTSALTHGFPISSSASRSAIASLSGARSQLFGLTLSVAIVVILLGASSVLASFPVAALGALVIYAATKLVDVDEFRRLFAFRRREFLLAVTATAAVLAFGILYGILAAVGISVVELLTRVARPHAAVLGQEPGLAGWHDLDDYPEASQIPGLLVFRYDSPLFFANANDFVADALAALDQADPAPDWLLLNMEAIVQIDITGLDGLRQLVEECEHRGVTVALVRVKLSIVRLLMRHGVGQRIGQAMIFPTLPTAVEAFTSRTGSGA